MSRSRKSRKRSRTRRVRQEFSQAGLARICALPEEEFAAEFGMETVRVAGYAPDDFYCFRDNGASVLAVAHLDTVQPRDKRAANFVSTQAGPVVFSGALDDRLGAYIILELLPRLGITHDWLLTTGEERGQSTAECFGTPKDYDWIIEFDRGGTDVVMYQYEDAETRQAVKMSGAVVGDGIFSDISYMDHLGVKAFNWGTGYRDYHSPRSHAYLNDTFTMVAHYLRFHAMFAGTAMPHTPAPKTYATTYRTKYDYRTKYEPETEAWETCEMCWARASVDPITLCCQYCSACSLCGEDTADGCRCFTPDSRETSERVRMLTADENPRLAITAASTPAVTGPVLLENRQ